MTATEFCNRVLPLKDKLYRLARRILINSQEAEDAVQESFYKLWLKHEELETLKSMEAFAMTVTKNFCIDRIKSKGYHTAGLNGWNEADEERSPEMMTELKDEIGEIQRIINRLPAQQRMIIHLRDVEGLEFDEIEDIMDMKINAVRVTLSRARKSVRTQLIATHNYENTGS
jgi:RNA polymerase sigma factor (sigma-70 family)